MTRKGSRYLLESNLLLTVSSQDKWSGEINRQNFNSSSELILATDNAETKAMKSHVLTWQRKSLLHIHLFNQTVIWGKEAGGGAIFGGKRGERTQVKVSKKESFASLGESTALKPFARLN